MRLNLSAKAVGLRLMFEPAHKHLENLRRLDLAMLLSVCRVSIEDVNVDGWWDDLTEEKVVVRAPQPVADAIAALPQWDRKRVAEAVMSAGAATRSHEDILVQQIDGKVGGAVGLLAELVTHRGMMISVATGGDRIQDVNDYYVAREHRLRETMPSDVPYNNPHADLWDWYRHWREHLGGYSERREYVRSLFQPTINALTSRSISPSPKREPSGWERVDRTLGKARSQLSVASAEEDFQAVALLCREVIISLAQAVYDPAIHKTLDGVTPSTTDANRMLEAYVAHAFPGESYKEVRAHARASLALALNLQHRRTATRQLAALCIEATASTTAVVTIIARYPVDE